MKKEYKILIEIAQEAKKKAYAPYSNFQVGAALLSKDGRIFSGCNIENSSYGLTVCAERVAFFKAISSDVKKFKAIAIVSDFSGFTSPCGACRQVLFELGGNIEVILVNKKKETKIFKLLKLLPLAFTGKNLK